MKLLLSLAILFCTLNLYAQEIFFCVDELSSLPIRQNGRVKPLYVHSRETLNYLTGSSSPTSHSPSVAYCLLSLKGLGLETNINLQARIDHVDLKSFLNTKEKTLMFTDLLEKLPEIKLELQKNPDPTAYNKALSKLLSQVQLYQNIVEGNNWLVPAVTNSRVDWIPFKNFLREDEIKKLSKTHSNPFLFSLTQEAKKFDKLTNSTYKVELLYAKARLPQVAFVLTLISLAFLTLFRSFTFTLIFTSLTLFTQLLLIGFRVYISGRAPITNMYETVMFSGFGALLLAMIVGHLKKEKVFVYMGLMYNLCTLMMMNFATSMLSDSISPLVPVLRDNFWLSTHVTTIILSYGALALSWILANTVLIKNKLNQLSIQDLHYYCEQTYTCLKYGTIMLGAGVILGGVWADYSWGRFWGWDPKETWSLIAFVIYMSILHGRYTAWISPSRFIPLVALAFMSIMMAWFGVNYILASGLHSYGFSEGGAIFLGTFFILQIAVVLWTMGKLNFSQTKANA